MSRPLKNRNYRTSSGQGVLQGLAGVWVATGIAFLGTILFLNVGMAFEYRNKLRYVANALSAYMQGRADWCGCTRPDYNSLKVQGEAEFAAGVLLEKLGLPPLNKISFREFEIDGRRYCKVTLSVRDLRLPGGLCLPSAIDITEEGMSATSSGDCWGFAWMRYHEPAKNLDRGILVPTLAICPNKTNFDSSSQYSCKIRGTNFNCAVQIPDAQVSSPVLKTSPGKAGYPVAP